MEYKNNIKLIASKNTIGDNAYIIEEVDDYAEGAIVDIYTAIRKTYKLSHLEPRGSYRLFEFADGDFGIKASTEVMVNRDASDDYDDDCDAFDYASIVQIWDGLLIKVDNAGKCKLAEYTLFHPYDIKAFISIIGSRSDVEIPKVAKISNGYLIDIVYGERNKKNITIFAECIDGGDERDYYNIYGMEKVEF